jgi:TolA-binding protein
MKNILIVVLALIAIVQFIVYNRLESGLLLLENSYKEQQSDNTAYIIQLETQVYDLKTSIEELEKITQECIKKTTE